jgi:hypothetical protein
MATINIPESENDIYLQFIQGAPVSVSAVALNNEDDFKAGEEVTISHLNMEVTAKIVERSYRPEDASRDKKVFTVTVQKV